MSDPVCVFLAYLVVFLTGFMVGICFATIAIKLKEMSDEPGSNPSDGG